MSFVQDSDAMGWTSRLRAALGSGQPSEPLLEVIEHLPDAITLSEAVRDETGRAVDMRLLHMNRQAREGQPRPEQAIGGLCSELWPDMVSNGSFHACMRVLDTGSTESGVFDWRDAATYRPAGYEWRAVRVGDDVLLWVLRDISDQLRHREDITDVHERVVQSLISAGMALELGDEVAAAKGIERALDAAKMVVTRELIPTSNEAKVPRVADTHVRGPTVHDMVNGGIRTVVCDDDAFVREILRRVLDSGDHFVVVGEAADGKEVVAVTQAQQPDLVLIDMNMPEMSGMEAIPLLRDVAPGATIVALSSLKAEAAASDAMAAGATAYIEKGSSVAAIRDRLQSLFP